MLCPTFLYTFLLLKTFLWVNARVDGKQQLVFNKFCFYQGWITIGEIPFVPLFKSIQQVWASFWYPTWPREHTSLSCSHRPITGNPWWPICSNPDPQVASSPSKPWAIFTGCPQLVSWLWWLCHCYLWITALWVALLSVWHRICRST